MIIRESNENKLIISDQEKSELKDFLCYIAESNKSLESLDESSRSFKLGKDEILDDIEFNQAISEFSGYKIYDEERKTKVRDVVYFTKKYFDNDKIAVFTDFELIIEPNDKNSVGNLYIRYDDNPYLNNMSESMLRNNICVDIVISSLANISGINDPTTVSIISSGVYLGLSLTKPHKDVNSKRNTILQKVCDNLSNKSPHFEFGYEVSFMDNLKGPFTGTITVSFIARKKKIPLFGRKNKINRGLYKKRD